MMTIQKVPAITPKNPATANRLANVLATNSRLNVCKVMICITVMAKTMQSTSVIADSRVRIE